ncbi:MAG: type II secretion system protein GspL [Pseudomonadota bacterium]
MQSIAVIRRVAGRLAWYPAGAGEEPRWLDDEATADELRLTLSQRRTPVCFAAPGADTRLLTLAVSPAERKHIAKSLPFTLEEDVADDIDDLHFSSRFIDKELLGVAVCSRNKMDEWAGWLAAFPGAGRWIPEPLLLPWQPGEWCIVLEGDDAIIRTGQCHGFAIERDMVGALLSGVLAEEASDDGDEPASPEAVVVYGSDQAEDTAILPEALQDRVQWRQGNLYAAMMLQDDNLVDLNLLQGDYAVRLPLGRWWRQWRLLAAAFAGAFMLQVAAVYADYRSLNTENVALRSAVMDSYRRAYPSGNVVDPEKQLQRQLDALRGTSQSSGFITLIEPVGAAIAGMPGTEIVSINYSDRGDEIRLNIVAPDYGAVEKLRTDMSDASLEAVIETSSATPDGKVRARLRVGQS